MAVYPDIDPAELAALAEPDPLDVFRELVAEGQVPAPAPQIPDEELEALLPWAVEALEGAPPQEPLVDPREAEALRLRTGGTPGVAPDFASVEAELDPLRPPAPPISLEPPAPSLQGASEGLDLQQQEQLYRDAAAVPLAVEAKRQELDEDAHIRDIEDREMAKINAADAKRQARIDVARAQADEDFADYRARVQQGVAEVDPTRFWSSKSTGEQIMGGVAVMFGSLASGGYGPNKALQYFQGLVERDIDAQKANIQSQIHATEQMRGLVADEYRRTGDMERAAATMRAAAMGKLKEQLAVERGRYNQAGTRAMALAQAERSAEAAMAQAEAKAREGMLDQRIKVGEYEIKLREQDRKERKDMMDALATSRRGRGGGGKSKKEKLEDSGVLRDVATELGADTPEERKRIVMVNPDAPIDRRGALANTFEDAKELQGLLDLAEDFTFVAQRLERSMDVHGWEPKSDTWAGGVGKMMMRDRAELVTTLNRVKELGVLAGPDLELLTDLLGGEPGAFNVGGAGSEALRTTRRDLIDRVNRKLKRRNVHLPFAPPEVGPVSTTGPAPDDLVLEAEAGQRRGDAAGYRDATKALIEELDTGDLVHKDRIDEYIAKYEKIPRDERVVPDLDAPGGSVDPLARLHELREQGTASQREETEEDERKRKAKEDRAEAERKRKADVSRGGRETGRQRQ